MPSHPIARTPRPARAVHASTQRASLTAVLLSLLACGDGGSPPPAVTLDPSVPGPPGQAAEPRANPSGPGPGPTVDPSTPTGPAMIPGPTTGMPAEPPGPGPLPAPATDAGGPALTPTSGPEPELDPAVRAEACQALTSDPNVNWRDSALKSDRAIVACLSGSLGRAVGYGEAALGGYDPAGASKLTVITKGGALSVEQQLADAVVSEEHRWIVFDKRDFADPTDVALYRLHCDDAAVQAALGVSDAALCLDHEAWCAAHGVAARDCDAAFFNDRLNDSDLPIRNVRIGSHTTIDGRQSQARFRFSGFAIGSDSGGQPIETAESVIVTNLSFLGAGHTEDHGLDPDMLRVTGASHDIWIHQNTFELTGDAAFDVKVGANHITISFNRVQNVKRASLHGSSDSREINAQITTTIHHNAFITTDDLYDTFGNTARRVPLIRRGQAHLFNNVFYGYRKDILSVRVGARVAFEDNLFLANPSVIGEDDLGYFAAELLADFREGGLSVSGSFVTLSDANYRLLSSPGADLSASHGSTPDMLGAYSQASRDAIAAHRSAADQSLVDYVMATAGKGGDAPFTAMP